MTEQITQVVFVLIALVTGFLAAHVNIATECKKFGAFSVGETVYECKAR